MIEDLLTNAVAPNSHSASLGDPSPVPAAAGKFFDICQALLSGEAEPHVPQVPLDSNSQETTSLATQTKVSTTKPEFKSKDNDPKDPLQSLSGLLVLGQVLIANPLVVSPPMPNAANASSQADSKDGSSNSSALSSANGGSTSSSPLVSQDANSFTPSSSLNDSKAEAAPGFSELQALPPQPEIESGNTETSPTSVGPQPGQLPQGAERNDISWRISDAALPANIPDPQAQPLTEYSTDLTATNTSPTSNGASDGMSVTPVLQASSSQVTAHERGPKAKSAQADPSSLTAGTPQGTSAAVQQKDQLQNVQPQPNDIHSSVLNTPHKVSVHVTRPESRNAEAGNGLADTRTSTRAVISNVFQSDLNSETAGVSTVQKGVAIDSAPNPPAIAPSAPSEITSRNTQPDISQDCTAEASAKPPDPHVSTSGDVSDSHNTIDPAPTVSKRDTEEDSTTSAPAPTPQVAFSVSNPVATAPVATISSEVAQKAPSPEKVASGGPCLNHYPEPQAHSALSSGPVQLAHMVNRAAQSEMRIEFSTSVFGDVEVRTVVRASDVGVVIGSQKGDLQTLLANDLPSISGHLQQQNLHLTQVSFHSQGFDSAAGSSSDGNSQQRSFTSKAAPSQPFVLESPTEESSSMPEIRSGAGLSVLA